jgi:peptidyl-prolyl cis-trans isomerase SurA
MRLLISGRFRKATSGMPCRPGHSFLASCRKRNRLPVRSLAAAFLILWGSLLTVQAEVTNRIVAVVNNEIITWMELEKKMLQLLPPGKPVNNAEIQNQVLFQMIDQKLLEAQIRKLNLQVGKEEIDKAILRIQDEQGIKSPQEFAAALARGGITEEELRVRLKDQILRFRLISREIGSKIIFSEDQISAYYQKNKSKFESAERLHLAQITVSNSDYPNPEAAKAKIEEIAALLRQGEPFAALAQKFSRDPSAAQGGDLGFFLVDEIDPLLMPVLSPLKPGETCPVQSTPEGWRIVKLLSRETTKAASPEETREKIQEMVYQAEIEARAEQWILKLRERSSIQILL